MNGKMLILFFNAYVRVWHINASRPQHFVRGFEHN